MTKKKSHITFLLALSPLAMTEETAQINYACGCTSVHTCMEGLADLHPENPDVTWIHCPEHEKGLQIWGLMEEELQNRSEDEKATSFLKAMEEELKIRKLYIFEEIKELSEENSVGACFVCEQIGPFLKIEVPPNFEEKKICWQCTKALPNFRPGTSHKL